MAGWALWDGQPVGSVEVHLDGVPVGGTATGSPLRPDVASSLGQPDAVNSGWNAVIDMGSLAAGSRHRLTVTVGVPPSPAPVELAAFGVQVAGPSDREVGEGARLHHLERVVAELEATVEHLTLQMNNVAEDMRGHADWLASLDRWVNSCVKILSGFGAQPLDHVGPAASGALDVVGSLVPKMDVVTVMDWIAHAGVVREGPLVSVTLATRDRPELLRSAVNSVLTQSYPRIELVVVDDSDDETTASVLAGIDDPRLTVIRTEARRGPGAAYNVGLDNATGDIICFLDDDNLMHPEWVRSVVWAFEAFPERSTLYGARVVEDPGARHGERSGLLPSIEFARYDRERHEQANFVDRNTVALRAEHRGVRYDETLNAAFDWDQSLRLFSESPPLALPAISCFYRTVLAGRVSDLAETSDSVRRVRARTHTTRPLRVLVHSAMYPVISETYIGEDIEALVESGAEVTVTAVQEAASRSPGSPMARLDVDQAIEDSRPDLALMHWSTHAEGEVAVMERHHLPFAVRTHSFDLDYDRVARLMAHPLCVAVLCHPHCVDVLPQGVVPLLPSVGTGLEIPDSPADRHLVLSVSAGLPKKDFAFLIETMAAVPEFERKIILARSNGLLDLPDEVMATAAERDAGIAVAVNLPRQDVLEDMARASVLLYTLADGDVMGFPMSIVEAMLCGTIVIAPDRLEARAVVGEGVRTYSSGEDIIGHIHQIAAGGPGIEAERQALVARAQRHRTPEVLGQLHRELNQALTRWRFERV